MKNRNDVEKCHVGFEAVDEHTNGGALVNDMLKISWAAYTVACGRRGHTEGF